MKEYTAPEMEVIKYNDEDILLISDDNFSVNLYEIQ